MAIECLKNIIGLELGYNGRPKRACKIPVYVTCEQVTVKHYGRMWDTSRKKMKKKFKYIKISAVRNITNAVKRPGSIVSVPNIYLKGSVCFTDDKVETVRNCLGSD